MRNKTQVLLVLMVMPLHLTCFLFFLGYLISPYAIYTKIFLRQKTKNPDNASELNILITCLEVSFNDNVTPALLSNYLYH